MPITTIWPDVLPVEPDPVEPVPVELEPVPASPVPAFPLPEPVPVTCWPTVRLTEATVPAMVEVSEASFRLVCAVESEDSADVTEASSESIWLVEALAASSLDEAVLGRGQLGLRRVDILR